MPDTDQPNWDVHVIEFARSKDQLVAGLVHGAYDEGTVDVPFSFVLAAAEPMWCWSIPAS